MRNDEGKEESGMQNRLLLFVLSVPEVLLVPFAGSLVRCQLDGKMGLV